MHLEKPKRLIIWNGGSSSLLKSTKTIQQGTAHVHNRSKILTLVQFNAKQYKSENYQQTISRSFTNQN